MLIKQIKIGIGTDSRAFSDSVLQAASSLDALAGSYGRAKSASSGFDLGKTKGGGFSGGSSSGSSSASDGGGAAMGTQASVIAASLRPLQTIGQTISAQLNAVGGTITTLARRIDASMKYPAAEKALDLIQTKLRSGISSASTAAAGSLTRLQKITLSLGPAADKAISAYRGFSKIKSIWEGMGDVAKKSLSQLGGPSGFGKGATAATAFTGTVKTATSTVKGLGLQIGLAFGAVGIVFKMASAVKDFIGGGISGAIDLNESLSKTREVFGGASGEITGLADSMAKSYGFAKGPILDAASNIGLIGQGAGQSAKQSASMSIAMTKLAADASSFYNVPIDSALEKIRAGLVGESEPLRQFGVLLSEDAVKAEAMKMGLISGTQKLDEQGKVAARVSLIQAGLTKANGDLGRTFDQTKNASKNFVGTLTNLATDVGMQLLPAINVGIELLSGFATKGAAAFGSFKPALTNFVGGVTEAFNTVGVIFNNFDMVMAITMTKGKEMGLNLIQALAVVPENFSIISDYLKSNWYKLLTDVLNATRKMSDNIDKNLVGLYHSIQDLFSGKGFHFEWTGLLDGFEATAEKMPELVKPAFVSLQAEVKFR